MQRARELASLLAAGPPLVFAAIKEVARESEATPFREAIAQVMRRGFPTVATLYASEDQREGARAFAEKRDPAWTGR
jgi:crotonobetainyl-CoA hydratase